jgi:AraC-like DNA-binding protein
MVKAAAVDSPVIKRVRIYIAEQHTDKLTLDEVARSVNMSAFYFCRTFKKTTG